MRISRFSNFLNESHTQDEETFKYVFIDLIDEGFEMEFEKGFFSDLNSGYSENADQERRKAGYIIKLTKSLSNNGSVDFESAKTTMSLLEDCNSKLGGYGEFSLKDISFDDTHFRIEYRLIDNESEEEEVNASEGFDDFVGIIKGKWRGAYNKLTRSFDLKITKEGITLSPKEEEEVNTRSLLSTAKTFIHKCVDRKYWRGGGPNWTYKYDVELEGDKIHITFKERIDETIYR